MKKLLVLGLLLLALPAKAVKIFSTTGSSTVVTSSAPPGNFSTALYAAVASGTTFYAVPPVDSAISLKRICVTVAVAGIGGAGDAIYCNTSAGVGLSVTSASAASAGTTTCASGAATIALSSQIFCHIETSAASQPFLTTSVEYTLP